MKLLSASSALLGPLKSISNGVCYLEWRLFTVWQNQSDLGDGY